MTTREICERTNSIRDTWRARKIAEAERKAEHERNVKEKAEKCVKEILNIFSFMANNLQLEDDVEDFKITIKIDMVTVFISINPDDNRIYDSQMIDNIRKSMDIEVLHKVKEIFAEETGIKVKISNGVMEIRHRWDVVGEFVLTV